MAEPVGGLAGVAEFLGRVLWCGTAVGVLFGTVEFLIGWLAATGAPQQAAAAAGGVAWAILPYIAARTWDNIFRPWPTR